MRQQKLPGNKDSAEIRDLEGGISYSVRVTALVGDREGAPVSIVVTTRRRMCGLEGGLGAGLVFKGWGLWGRIRAGAGEGLRAYSEPVWVESGEERYSEGLVSLGGRVSLIVMFPLKRLRHQPFWRLFK